MFAQVCYGNQLTTLPDLPMCQDLWCSYNQLTTLPELPMCQILCCEYNHYPRSIADHFDLTFHSQGAHQHFRKIWRSQIKQIKLNTFFKLIARYHILNILDPEHMLDQ